MPNNTNNSIVSISGTDVTKIEYHGQPVVTFAMIDKVHERVDGTARRAFNENRERFIESEDYVLLSVSQKNEIRSFGIEVPNRGLTLITQRGYLKLTKPMQDDRAWQVQGEMIDRYFAIEQIAQTAKVTPLDKTARETRLFMRQALQIANLAGLSGNQRLIAANRSTRKATGFDYLAEMGVQHLAAPQNDTLINATTIGEKLGAVSAMRVNHLLSEHGFQVGDKDAKGRTYWVPTEKGIAAGGVMTDVERSNKTGQARQLRWASSIVDVLRDIIGRAA